MGLTITKFALNSEAAFTGRLLVLGNQSPTECFNNPLLFLLTDNDVCDFVVWAGALTSISFYNWRMGIQIIWCGSGSGMADEATEPRSIIHVLYCLSL